MEANFKKWTSMWSRAWNSYARVRRKKSVELDSRTLERIRDLKRLRRVYRKSRFNPVRLCANCSAPVVPDHYQTASAPYILCQVCRLLRTGDPDGAVPFDDDEDE